MVDTADFSSRLNTLLKFGFGGSEVARDPQDDTDSPVNGPMPAGADVVVSWFVGAIETSEEKNVILFLVGAPGNGKSFIAKRVREAVDPRPVGGNVRQLHSRIYRYPISRADRNLTVVNDASIDGESGLLTRDIDDAILQNSHLMVNVNRGVLQEELSAPQTSLGSQLVRWAASDGSREFSLSDGFQVEAERPTGPSAVRAMNLLEGTSGRAVMAVALYLDAYSLFEIQPEVRVADDYRWPKQASRYQISKIEKRKTPEFTSRTPAGEFSKLVIDWMSESLPSGSNPLDPFVANVQSLLSPEVQANLYTLVRCGEIAGAKRLSYRELWGLFDVLICGSYDSDGGRTTPYEWLDSHLTAVPDEAEQSEWLKQLGNCRLHQALFGSEIDETRSGVNPVNRLMSKVDPVHDTLLDAEPSMERVHSSFYGNEHGESILEQLLRIVGDESPMHSVVTDFDREIDRRVSRLLKSDNEARGRGPERDALLRWYGGYLTRLFALANGLSGFTQVISSWIESWNTAASSADAPLRGNLERGLRELIIPNFDGHGYAYIPPFDARCEPIRVAPIAPRLALRLETQLRLKSYVSGERLIVRVLSDDVDSDKKRIEFEADFDLFREVLASSSKSTGFTESHARTTPRIERFRSGLASWGANMEVISIVNSSSSPMSVRVRRSGNL
jgi:hypothetical protein